MPIRFRCTHCQQLLSVSRKQAGAGVTCPACGKDLRVPSIEGLTPPASGAAPPVAAVQGSDAIFIGRGDVTAAIGAPSMTSPETYRIVETTMASRSDRRPEGTGRPGLLTLSLVRS